MTSPVEPTLVIVVMNNIKSNLISWLSLPKQIAWLPESNLKIPLSGLNEGSENYYRIIWNIRFSVLGSHLS